MTDPIAVARAQLEKRDTGPKNAHEALELVWELAHPVKEGQIWPDGAQGISKVNGEFHTFTANYAYPVDEMDVLTARSLDPLPEPEPDWLDAPAVLARVDNSNISSEGVFTPSGAYPDRWVMARSVWAVHWSELTDVTPLYPKEDA